MDLSSTRFLPDHEMTVLPTDLAVLLVGAAARQVGSPTALVQVRVAPTAIVDRRLFAPQDGAFNGPMATLLSQDKTNEERVYRGVSGDVQVPPLDAVT